jgi:colicin import membrane protein
MPRSRRSKKSLWPAVGASRETRQALGFSLAVHVVLVVMLVVGWKWQSESPGPLQVELWTEGSTMEFARTPDEPTPEPEPEPTPEPEPEPAPEPEPTPPPEPEIADAPEPDLAAREAEIALAEEKERERLEQARLEAERKAKEEAEQQAKLEAERKAKQEAEQQAKLEAERKAKQEAEQQAKLEAERKAKQEAERQAKLEAERKAKEEAARRAAAEQKAKEAAQAAAREQALRDAFRSDVAGATGIAGGTASRNQQGGGADAGYAGLIRACIQPNVSFPTPVRSGQANPTVQFRVQLKSDGTVASTSLRSSSNNAAFDRAVENGIRRCSPFPQPPSGRYPSYIDVNYRMYD